VIGIAFIVALLAGAFDFGIDFNLRCWIRSLVAHQLERSRVPVGDGWSKVGDVWNAELITARPRNRRLYAALSGHNGSIAKGNVNRCGLLDQLSGHNSQSIQSRLGSQSPEWR
jgi:hypothetical protein